jgi:hypothetical protein
MLQFDHLIGTKAKAPAQPQRLLHHERYAVEEERLEQMEHRFLILASLVRLAGSLKHHVHCNTHSVTTLSI